MISRQFVLFLFSGGIAAGVNFGSRILFSHWMPYPAAIVLSFMVGLATAFMLMRTLAFKQSRNDTRTQALWFLLVNALALLQTFCVSLLLARWLLPALGIVRGAETIAHAIGVAMPVVTSYIGHKRLSFRN